MWILACPSTTPATAIIAATIATTATMAEGGGWVAPPGLLNRSGVEECSLVQAAVAKRPAVDWQQQLVAHALSPRATHRSQKLRLTGETAPDPPTIHLPAQSGHAVKLNRKLRMH